MAAAEEKEDASSPTPGLALTLAHDESVSLLFLDMDDTPRCCHPPVVAATAGEGGTLEDGAPREEPAKEYEGDEEEYDESFRGKEGGPVGDGGAVVLKAVVIVGVPGLPPLVLRGAAPTVGPLPSDVLELRWLTTVLKNDRRGEGVRYESGLGWEDDGIAKDNETSGDICGYQRTYRPQCHVAYLSSWT